MGKFYYGSNGTAVDFDDRLLAHLEVVIVTKLRREEKFTLSWTSQLADGPSRCSVWLHPAIELQFHFDDAERAQLNRNWVTELMSSANSGSGMQIVPEPGIVNS